MADDVKVKFSGDFTDVPKGASNAAQAAGTAMKGFASDLLSSMTGAVGGIFAVGTMIGFVQERIAGAREYFYQLHKAIEQTGVKAEELQKVIKVGKTLGIEMETTVKSVGLFSKYMGNASKDANTHGKTLRELGFSNKDITSGTITLTQVLGALSNQLESTGNEYQLAAYATEIFGKSGRELIPIIKQGKEAMDEQTKGMKIYTQGELDMIAASERVWRKRGNATKGFFAELWADIRDETQSIFGDSIDSVDERLAKLGGRVKLMKEDANNVAGGSYNKELMKEMQKRGLTLEAQEEMFKSHGNQQGIPAPNKTYIQDLQAAIEEEKKKKKEMEGNVPEVSGAALSSSSLQSIGGGDITSVLAGTSPMDQTAENTRQTVIYLKTIAEKSPVQTTDEAVTK